MNEQPNIRSTADPLLDGDAVGERFRRHVRRLNVRGARFGGALIAILVPAFSILDYLVLRPVFYELLVLRVAVVLIAFSTIGLSFSARMQRYVVPMTMILFASCGLSIVGMVHLHDWIFPWESPSHYYAGTMLVMIGATLMTTWRVWESVIVFGGIYLAYLLPTILFQPPAHAVMYLSNNFFLGATVIIATVGHYFMYGLHRREVESGYRMELANQRLTELDRYKTQFFANITHELKTPLTLILAPTESILKGEMGTFTGEQQEIFHRIYRNGLRLMKLISDLLDLAKLEDSKLRLRLDEIDLAEFLNELVSNIQPLAERKEIDLTYEVRGAETGIWSDHGRLEQILINLLSNAVKFTGEGGRVRVVCDATGQELHVSVQDSGIGIPQDKLRIIFDRFSQVDGSSTRKYGGTGIGLALAKELVGLHEGRLWAESEVDRGTTMHVAFHRGREHFRDEVIDRRQARQAVPDGRRSDDGGLPEWWAQISASNEFKLLAVDDATERRLAPRSRSASEQVEPQARILVVEDSKEMLQFLEMQLRARYVVYLAENGRKGLDLCRKLKPDLVVTDYMMPEMDGREMTREIKLGEGTAHIPVVMLTAKADEADRIAGREAGADQYLAKPFSPSELLVVIAKLLSSQEQQAEKLMHQRMDSLQVVAARLAHEIHNPVNYIRNGAVLAQRSLTKLEALLPAATAPEDELPGNRARFVTKIAKMLDQVTLGADRISKSVDLLREYSREGYTPLAVDYDVDEGMGRVLGVVAPRDNSRRNVHYESGGVGSIRCVPQEFHEVVSNLVQNAIDATPEDGNVWCQTLRDGENVRIVVRDDGEGIPQENIDKIFSPMFTTKAPGEGMGMGLAITYQLLKKRGGKMQVMSERGVGTTFTITWPVTPPLVQL
ncbi:MAG: ATP-binding protein [Pseudomonadota bacterium]